MDRQYPWKRTEDIEIDLADLLRKICMQWKRIAACALVSAVILGGYGWMKGRDGEDAAASGTAEEAGLTEEEEQSVEAAVRLEKETGELETYLDNSILMQLDPYYKNRFVMLYCIDDAQSRELPKITESYLNFILNGGAADALRKTGSWKMDKSYLAEVITAYQKTYSSPYQVTVDASTDSSMLSESLFYVEITGKNSRAAKKMALDMQNVLKSYSAKVKETAGKHKLDLISGEMSVTADSGIQAQQRDKKNLLLSNQTSLKTMTDAFTKEQMTVYKEMAGFEDEDDEGTGETEKEVSDGNLKSWIKYIVLGFAGGIFIYCGIFSCWYLFCDTVKSAEEMKRMYTFPFYGDILLESGGRKKHRQAGRRRLETCESKKAQVLNRIRLACKKQGITTLYAVSDFALCVKEREYLESAARQLKSWGIHIEAAENGSTDTALWDSLTETGNILLVCRIGTTTHRMIDNVMRFYQENGISVIGAAAFLPDK